MIDGAREYGAAGRVGLITPPANTTIEPEMAMMLLPGMALYTSRLPGRVAHDTSIGLRERLHSYAEYAATVACAFGGAELDALCFGVTGSAYLVGVKGEERLIGALKAGGAREAITASRAITWLLRSLGSKRIAIVSPYPSWLTEKAVEYWHDSLFEVAHVVSLADVVSIYDVTSLQVVDAVKHLTIRHVDSVLLSGTGVPTLAAIAALQTTVPVPVISSNLSLGLWVENLLGPATSSRLSAAGLNAFIGRVVDAHPAVAQLKRDGLPH